MEFINTLLDTAFAATLLFTALWLPVQFAAYVSRRLRTQASDSTPLPIAQLPPSERQPIESQQPIPAAIALESIDVTIDRAIALSPEWNMDGSSDQKRYEFNLARSVELEDVPF